MQMLIAGLTLFVAIHLVPQTPTMKDRLSGVLGMHGYRLLHGVAALVAVYLMYVGYSEATNEIVLWYPPIWTRHLAATIMLFASILLFAAPFAGKIKQALTSPLSVAIKSWAVAHLLANGSLADLLLFGVLLFYAVSYRISLKRRIAQGRASVPQGRWIFDLYAVILGSLFYVVVLFWLHEWAFGVAPLG